MNTYHLGIMLGRLSPSRSRGIQFFPFDSWEEEFFLAEKIGLDEIEFIFDYDNYLNNPLWMNEGEMLGDIIRRTNIRVKSVCFDYFMRRPFYKYPEDEQEMVLKENEEILLHVLRNMEKQGIFLVEIPLVDGSSLKKPEESSCFRKFLKSVMKKSSSDIRFGLETDLPPKKFREYLDSFGCGRVGANYDTGNSSGAGYDPHEEVTTLGKYIFNIHIKDRVLHGTTVELGTGDADFDSFFRALSEIDYDGSFIMQAARGEDGKETETIKSQIDFVKGYIKKYLV